MSRKLLIKTKESLLIKIGKQQDTFKIKKKTEVFVYTKVFLKYVYGKR